MGSNIQLYVMGTLIYKRSLGLTALKNVAKDLDNQGLESIVSDLDGPFFMVVWRISEKKIYFVTDHAGIMNVYHYRMDNKSLISSSALSLSKPFPVTLNKEAMCQFLRTGSICDYDTIYNEIELL